MLPWIQREVNDFPFPVFVFILLARTKQCCIGVLVLEAEVSE